jgi:hypothetical protein
MRGPYAHLRAGLAGDFAEDAELVSELRAASDREALLAALAASHLRLLDEAGARPSGTGGGQGTWARRGSPSGRRALAGNGAPGMPMHRSRRASGAAVR